VSAREPSAARLRRARSGDVAELEVLLAELEHPTSRRTLEANLVQFEELWPRHAAFVAEIEGAVVALVTVSAVPMLHRTSLLGRISSFVVSAELTGRGIGTRLLEHAEAHLVSVGCGHIEVTSAMRRERAHRFYEERGYARQGLRFVRAFTSHE
jgi:GNAT superfamily N-acetyltransferase